MKKVPPRLTANATATAVVATAIEWFGAEIEAPWPFFRPKREAASHSFARQAP